MKNRKIRLLAYYKSHTLARMAETRKATAYLRKLEPLLTEMEIEVLCAGHHVSVTTWDDEALLLACKALMERWEMEG